MPHIERTITVPGRQEDVWAFLSDFTTTEQWDPPTQHTERIHGDGGIGTRYRNVSKVLGSTTEIIYTVVVHEPPRRLELDGRTSSMTMHDSVVIEQDGPDVRIVYRAEFFPEGGLKLLTPLLPPALKVLGDSAAKQMEDCLLRRAARPPE